MFSTLGSNQKLEINQSIFSQNRMFELIMQQDGNLVLYRTANRFALWATGTVEKDVKYAIMQDDGNLVLYTFRGKPIWASNTNGNPNSYLAVQDDGNLVIYQTVPSHDDPTWASQTNE